MYSTKSGLVLGFHGCDASIINDILLGGSSLEKSTNQYDWLGHGIYFWENSPSRAKQFATQISKIKRAKKKPIKNPSVIGAVIDLGLCLDLFDYRNLIAVKDTYDFLVDVSEIMGDEMPQNKNVSGNEDLLLRDLDCAVIQTLHKLRENSELTPYDSVRGIFTEGNELYEKSGFREKDHVQICVRNPNCIKGYFLPREIDDSYLRP